MNRRRSVVLNSPKRASITVMAVILLVVLSSPILGDNAVDSFSDAQDIIDTLARPNITPRQLYLARKRAYGLVKKFPDSTVCLRVLARALDRSKMWYEASRRWKKILIIIPDDEEALLSLADHHIIEGLRYKDMVGGGLSMARFGKEDLEKAVSYLATFRSTRHGGRKAEMRLAELALVLGNWQEAIRYATPLDEFSGQRLAGAVLGAALVRVGDQERAAEAFARFFSASSDSVRRLFNDLAFFFQREGLHFSEDACPTNQDSAAWAERDPRLLTGVNERLLEHYARVAIASVRLSSRPGAWDGWRMEPGVLLVRYGEPEWELRRRPEFGDNGDISYEKLEWQYDDIVVTFEDGFMNRKFSLSGGRTDDGLTYVEVVNRIDKEKEKYDPHGGEAPLGFALGLWLLPRTTGVLAAVASDVKREELDFAWDEDQGSRAMLKTVQRWRKAGEKQSKLYSSTFLLSAQDARGCDSPGFSLSHAETLTAGKWELSLELEDVLSGRWERRDTLLVIKPVSKGRLTLGGPVPCWTEESMHGERTLLELSDLIPTATPVYSGEDTLVMYFEFHGLALTSRRIHHGTIRYTVRQRHEGAWWKRLFRKRISPQISADIEMEGPGTGIISHLILQLPKAETGTFEFLLTCIDELTGREVKGRTTLHVCSPGGGMFREGGLRD